MHEWIVEVRQPGRAVLRLHVGAPLEVGRECDGLLLADPKVSRRHARLVPTGSGVEVDDLGSRNGTWVDGAPIAGPTVLAPDATALVGDTVVAVRGRHRGEAPAPVGVAATLDPRSSIAAVLSAVESTGTDRTAPPVHDGTVTILFSDIESSTELAQRLGDHAWLELLSEHNAIVRGCLRAEGGTEVKTIGDGFMVTFGSARRGVVAAVAMQRALARRADGDTWPVRVRIGLHTGEVLRERDDLFGTHVNLAARVAGQARGGEILVSGLLHDLVLPVIDVGFDAGRELELKGLAGRHRVHAIAWDRDRDGDRDGPRTRGAAPR